MKKNLATLTVLSLTFLLSLGVMFAGGNFVPAHAATNQQHQSLAMTPAPPNLPPDSGTIRRVDCGSPQSDFFKILSEGHIVCFANSGTTTVVLYNVLLIYTGNNLGEIIWKNDSMPPHNVRETFPKKNTYYLLNNGQAVNRVLSIRIY